MPLFGLLNVDKPVGWTSRDVVNRVQRLVPGKVGHTGTLDPLATGVLVICVGPATRLTQYVQQMPKKYRASFRLGCRSESDDLETEVEPVPGAARPGRTAIENVLPDFLGSIEQRPPVYSAIKMAGRRACDRARRGERVELAPRRVTIHALTLADYDYPQVTLDIECGSGTYIRSLGRDLAAELATAAVMTRLQRTAVGEFTLADAVPADQLDAAGVVAALDPPETALTALAKLCLDRQQVEDVRHGRSIACPTPGQNAELTGGPVADFDPSEWAALDATGRLVAILHRKADGRLWPARNFAAD